MKSRVIAGAVCVFALATFFVARIMFVRADTATLYPLSCLGGWNNPHHAEGKPEVSDENSAALNTENSALLPADTVASIFCGDMVGDIPEGSYAQKMLLVLSWDVVRADVSSETAARTVSGDDFASSTGAILDASTQPDFTLTAPSSTDSTVPTAETSDPMVEPAAFVEPAGPIEPALDQASPADDAPQSSSFFDSSFASALRLVTPIASAEEVAPYRSGGNEFLEVLYTMDGATWKSLGTVDAEHLRYSVFQIPLPAIAKWVDVSRIQIGIKSIPSIDRSPSVYLDGMSLQVTYGAAAEDSFTSDSGLHIPSARSLSPNFDFRLRNRGGIEELVISGPASLGSIVIFNASTSVPVLTTFVEHGEFVLQPEYFGEGSYDIIFTRDPDNCQGKSVESCRTGAYFVGEGGFEVGATASTSSSTVDALTGQGNI